MFPLLPPTSTCRLGGNTGRSRGKVGWGRGTVQSGQAGRSAVGLPPEALPTPILKLSFKILFMLSGWQELSNPGKAHLQSSSFLSYLLHSELENHVALRSDLGSADCHPGIKQVI